MAAEEPGRHQVATVGPIVVMVLHAQPTEATVEALRAGRRQALQQGLQHAGKVSHLIVLAKRNVAPAPETRQAFASLLREAAGSTAAEAVVFEGQGMGGLMVRSVVRLIHAAARVYFPHRVTADLAEACSFLCDIHSHAVPVRPSSLASQVRALTARGKL